MVPISGRHHRRLENQWHLEHALRLATAVLCLNGGTPLPTHAPQRPNFVGEPRRSHGPDTYWVNNYFANPASIQTPAPFTLGNAPRTTGRSAFAVLFRQRPVDCQAVFTLECA